MSYVKSYVLQARDGGVDELRKVLINLKAAVTRLPGSLGVELLQDLDRPERLHFVERWASQADHAAAGKKVPGEIMQAMKSAMGAPPIAASLSPVADD